MKKIKVLLVEDDSALVSLLKTALSGSRFEVKLAGDVEAGLKAAGREKPNVIVLDILLPGRTGFDFLRLIKEKKETKKIPVIILSNLGQDEEIRSGLKLGAVSYLVKADFTIDEVLKEIIKWAKK